MGRPIQRVVDSECCASCGEPFNGRHICYFDRARVCIRCHTALADGCDSIKPSLGKELWGVVMVVAAVTLLFLGAWLFRDFLE